MLTSRQNPWVKQVRRLHQAKGREEQGLLLLEGSHLLAEALAAGYPIEQVCWTPDWQARSPELAAQLQDWAGRVELVSPEVMAVLATTQSPDGVVALAPRGGGLEPQLPVSLGLALDRIQDPGNLGTMLRTAVATGVEGLWVGEGGVALDHPKVLRASAGQWFRLPMAVPEDLGTVVGRAKAAGMQVVATRSEAKLSYWEVDWRLPTLVLLGNEGAGLSPALETMADVGVQIPLLGGVESLNVAIAAALILYEVRRQRDSPKTAEVSKNLEGLSNSPKTSEVSENLAV